MRHTSEKILARQLGFACSDAVHILKLDLNYVRLFLADSRASWEFSSRRSLLHFAVFSSYPCLRVTLPAFLQYCKRKQATAPNAKLVWYDLNHPITCHYFIHHRGRCLRYLEQSNSLFLMATEATDGAFMTARIWRHQPCVAAGCPCGFEESHGQELNHF